MPHEFVKEHKKLINVLERGTRQAKNGPKPHFPMKTFDQELSGEAAIFHSSMSLKDTQT